MRTIIAALALAAALTGCARDRALEKAPLPVSVQPVAAVAPTSGEQAALASRYSAVLIPRQQVSLAFKVPGYVDYLNPAALDKGARVTKGQPLARLREADYKAKRDQARSTLDEARASAAQARRDLERNARLVQGEVISRGEYERTQERLDVSQAKAAQAAAALEQAEINLRDAQIAAPFDAVVARRDVEPGTLVNQGTVAYVLADLSSVKAVFALPDQDIARVALGDTLSVAADALPGREFTGTVTAVSPTADPKSRAFDVEVTIPNKDLALKDGMVAAVRRSGRDGGPALSAIPLHALAKPGPGGGFVAYVLEEKDGKTVARARTVTVAGVAGDMVTILSGLAPGEQVITRGATLASDGQSVRVIR